MRSKVISGLMLILLFMGTLSLVFNIQLGEAQTRKVGVKAGDWIKYEVAYNYTTNDPNPPFLQPDVAYIEYYETEVLLVAGTNITFQTTTYLKNSTEMSRIHWVNISSNLFASPPFFFGLTLFIAANLEVGDTLTPNPISDVINSTLMRTYAGVERETNFVYHRSFSSIIRLTPPPSTEFWYDTTTHMLWDKATGVLVEANKTTKVTNLSEGYVTKTFIQMKTQETNIWSSTFNSAKVCVNPKSLNLKSKGKWITCYIELPEGYDVIDINWTTILLNDTIPVDSFWVDKPLESVVGDFDNDTIQDLMVKFSRAAVIDYLISQNIKQGNITLTLTGELFDGAPFEASDMIMVKMSESAKTTMPDGVDSGNENVIVMPEYASFLILPLFIIAALATVVYVKKRKKDFSLVAKAL